MKIEIKSFGLAAASVSFRHDAKLVVVGLATLDLVGCTPESGMSGPIARSGRRDWKLAFLLFLGVPYCRSLEMVGSGSRIDGSQAQAQTRKAVCSQRYVGNGSRVVIDYTRQSLH